MKTNPLTLKPRDSLDDPTKKRTLNAEIFTRIAPFYDRANRYLSFGRDRVWKDCLVAMLPPRDAPEILDLACGTGDLTRRLAQAYPNGRILGLDLTPAMIARAQAASPARVRFAVSDMGHTGLPSNSFDIVTGGYALRNAGHLEEALRETYRVLAPGGIAAFLDFSNPPGAISRMLRRRLLKTWASAWGLAFEGRTEAYGYIADSLDRFPDRKTLADRFNTAGFRIIRTRRFFGGMIDAVILGKPGSS